MASPERALAAAEQWAATGGTDELLHHSSSLKDELARGRQRLTQLSDQEFDTAYEDIGDLARIGFESAKRFRSAAHAVHAVELAIDAAMAACNSQHVESIRTVQVCSDLCARVTMDADALRRDWVLLSHASLSNRTRIDREFFSVRSVFDTGASIAEQPSIQIASAFDRDVIRQIGADPDRLLSMTPREFEEFVADLLAGLGYEVSLTRRTRDGGYDIAAVEHRILKCMYLVECKRYSVGNKVGVSAVRELHGVVSAKKATKGVIVTTSSFSAPAQEHIDEHSWILEGRDYQGLLEWLDRYQLYQLGFRSGF